MYSERLALQCLNYFNFCVPPLFAMQTVRLALIHDKSIKYVGKTVNRASPLTS